MIKLRISPIKIRRGGGWESDHLQLAVDILVSTIGGILGTILFVVLKMDELIKKFLHRKTELASTKERPEQEKIPIYDGDGRVVKTVYKDPAP